MLRLLLLHHEVRVVLLLRAKEVVVDLNGGSTAIFLSLSDRLCRLGTRTHLVIIAALTKCLCHIEQLINACDLLTPLIVRVGGACLQTVLVLVSATYRSVEALVKNCVVDDRRGQHRLACSTWSSRLCNGLELAIV